MRFPVFIDIEGKAVLVAGAGKIGCRRIKILLQFGADITVVSEDIYDSSLMDRVKFEKRKFIDRDIENKFMVIASTDDRNVNHRIYELCLKLGIPVSVADSPQESTFFFPAVCINEKLSIGVVSDGTDHKAVREAAEKIRSSIL